MDFGRILSKARERERQRNSEVHTEASLQDQDAWLTGEEYRTLVDHPTAAWRHLTARHPEKTVVRYVSPQRCDSPKPPNCVRFVCISDTHNQVLSGPRVPDGDVLIHAGDFTLEGYGSEVEEFVDFLRSLPHKHKIVIAGNHDIPFDPDVFKLFLRSGDRRSSDAEECPRLLQGVCTYLQDSEVTVEGYRVYGAPWQPIHMRWAFTLERGEALREKWKKIPEGIDFLVTHGPPLGYLDDLAKGGKAGCLDLLYEIKHRVKPKFHVFGHIHEGYGMCTDGVTTYVNAAMCDKRYRPRNRPIVIDLPVRGPDGAAPSPI